MSSFPQLQVSEVNVPLSLLDSALLGEVTRVNLLIFVLLALAPLAVTPASKTALMQYLLHQQLITPSHHNSPEQRCSPFRLS